MPKDKDQGSDKSQSAAGKKDQSTDKGKSAADDKQDQPDKKQESNTAEYDEIFDDLYESDENDDNTDKGEDGDGEGDDDKKTDGDDKNNDKGDKKNKDSSKKSGTDKAGSLKDAVINAEDFDDEIELGDKNEGDAQKKVKLVKVKIGNTIAYVPEGLKAGVMKDADYTQKTQELSKKEKEMQSQVEFVWLENMAFDLGARLEKSDDGSKWVLRDYNEPEPDKAEFITADPEVDERLYKLEKEKYDGVIAEWKKRKEDYEKRKVQYFTNIEATKTKNSEIVENFKKEYPDAEHDEVIKEAMTYLNPSITKGQRPMKDDTLLIFYRGKNFETLLSAEVEKARKEILDDLEDKGKKGKKAGADKGSKKNDRGSDDKDEYDDATEEGSDW